MNKFQNWLNQQLSHNTSKKAVSFIKSQKDGISAYYFGGFIFLGCGIVWLLISLIPIFLKNPFSDWGWIIILAFIHIIIGILIIVLSKKSKRFQNWANKDFYKSLQKQEQFTKKVKMGKRTLPITYGDIFALKILGIILIALIVILTIGYLQGWVKW